MSGSDRPSSGVESGDSSLPRLTSAQAAARLGIKPQTLYAYVARGLLSRDQAVQGRRGSTFDALEVERFATQRRRRPIPESSGGRQVGAPLMVIETTIALIEDDELYFCGQRAADLALSHPYESVADWLWTGHLATDVDHQPDVEAVGTARRVVAQLPPTATLRDRLQVATTTLGCLDPLRFDLSPSTVARIAGRYLAGVVSALPDLDSSSADSLTEAPSQGQPIEPWATPLITAARLWPKLTAAPSTDAGLRCLNAALVLLVDHDLAVSTLAARAAASARANPYAVVSAGLSALDSALHGNASSAAHRLVSSVLAGADPARAVADSVLHGEPGGIPGFGHRLYRDWDPRARLLLDLLDGLDSGQAAVTATHSIIDVVRRRTGRAPNVDLTLATLALATKMRPDAGEAIFAVGRSGGWLAHAVDEYARPPLRLRPVGHYTGV